MTRYAKPTLAQTEVLAFISQSGLRGTALEKALARERGIRPQSAKGHLHRLIAKGLLKPDGTPERAVSALLVVGKLLAELEVPERQRQMVLDARERILEVVG